jgi:hypothetical protein
MITTSLSVNRTQALETAGGARYVLWRVRDVSAAAGTTQRVCCSASGCKRVGCPGRGGPIQVVGNAVSPFLSALFLGPNQVVGNAVSPFLSALFLGPNQVVGNAVSPFLSALFLGPNQVVGNAASPFLSALFLFLFLFFIFILFRFRFLFVLPLPLLLRLRLPRPCLFAHVFTTFWQQHCFPHPLLLYIILFLLPHADVCGGPE